MKVGTIAYATSRGLGHLAHDFYLKEVITNVCVMRHRSIPMNEEWYPGARVVSGTTPADARIMRDFCRSMDAMLWFENPFDWELIPYCRSAGVRTYLVTMYECTPKSRHYGRYTPTQYLCPSALDMQYFPRQSTQVQLPVEYPWKLRTNAWHFVHNGGYLGIRGREGTTTLIEAMQYVKSPIRLTIRVQENVSDEHQRMMARDKRIEYINRQVEYHELYGTGDVCVGAQKWNGCSLVLQEAYASGMLIMNTKRFPMTEWLPNEPLVPPSRIVSNSCISGAYLNFNESIVEPRDLAKSIDFWYGRDISEFSLRGKGWSQENSWEKMLPMWKIILGGSNA